MEVTERKFENKWTRCKECEHMEQLRTKKYWCNKYDDATREDCLCAFGKRKSLCQQ